MNALKGFFARKDIVITPKRYLQEALSAMAIGLFSSLIIGLILKTCGQQLALLFGENTFTGFLVEAGTTAMGLMGAAIGVSVSYGLKAPSLVMFCGVITGSMGATLGGPAGAFVSAVIGAEFGKMISKETKLDIIVTPAVTIFAGFLGAKLFAPVVSGLMGGLGQIVMSATEMQPFLMGIVVATVMGLALTAPISSAALAIMLSLEGLAGGAATVGCAAQMIGFAVMSYKANGYSGLVSVGLGTSMLQIPNIVKNPWILLPPTLAGAIIAPLSTLVFKLTNVKEGSGMGTSGLVGQIGTFTSMGFNVSTIIGVVLLHFVLPAVITYVVYQLLVSAGKIKPEDLKLG